MTREPMTSERLAEIRERERMATEGPWVRWTDQEQIPGWDGFYVVGDDAAEGDECNPTARVYIDTDAEFIAHARQDVPDLLAEVDRLKARVGELTSLLNDPDRLADHLLALRAVLAEDERDAEIDRLADGGEV